MKTRSNAWWLIRRQHVFIYAQRYEIQGVRDTWECLLLAAKEWESLFELKQVGGLSE